MKELIEFLVGNIVEDSKAVKIIEEERDGVNVLKLSVNPSDMGRIIGREGKVIKAIRSLIKIKSLKEDKRVFLELTPTELKES